MRIWLAMGAMLFVAAGAAMASAMLAAGTTQSNLEAPNQPSYRSTVPMLARDGAGPVYVVSGEVVAGPTCPVERIPPDPRCAPRPVAGAVLKFFDADGTEAAQAVSDATGSFAVTLWTGTYTLVAQPVAGLMGTPPPRTLVVNGPMQITVMYDTGIR